MNTPKDRHVLLTIKGMNFPVLGKFYESYFGKNGLEHDAWTTVAGVYSSWKPAKEEDILGWSEYPVR